MLSSERPFLIKYVPASYVYEQSTSVMDSSPLSPTLRLDNSMAVSSPSHGPSHLIGTDEIMESLGRAKFHPSFQDRSVLVLVHPPHQEYVSPAKSSSWRLWLNFGVPVVAEYMAPALS